MATLDELQAQLDALTQRVNEITAPPDDYYTHRFSGEEIDNAVDRVKTTPGSGAITAGDVGAAPSGFGLGSNPVAISDANDAKAPGWYSIYSTTLNLPDIIPDAFNYTFLRVDRGDRPDAFLRQTIVSPYQSWRNCEIIRVYAVGVWQPWEWVNPPLLLGIEYRTTERFKGSSVYVKHMSLGAAPNATTKTINLEILGLKNVLGCQLFFSTGALAPYNHPNGSGLEVNYVAPDSGGIVIVTAKTDLSKITIYGILKYTKTE